MDTHILILGAASIIILSFFFNRIAHRTNIPSVLMLMLLGFCLKFIVPYGNDQFTEVQKGIELEEVDSEKPAEKPAGDAHDTEHAPSEAGSGELKKEASNPILELLKILGTVGVILIVLEAALDLHLEKQKLPLIGKASGLALVLLLATSGIIAMALHFVLGMSTFISLMYAVPLSVMSSAIIIPSVSSLIERKKEFLIFESAMSDILGIIVFYALLDVHHAGEGENVAMVLLGKTVLTIVLSILISYVLIIVFQYVKGHGKLFLLIASLMALYSMGKLLHLSSLIIILVFGLMLNNPTLFFRGSLSRFVKEAEIDAVLAEFKPITLETAFVVRTFFFVAFGFSIIPSQLLHWTVPVVTVLVLIAIYATRYIGLRTVYLNDIKPEIYVAPRGLITILLFYAIPIELRSESFAPGILLLTILVSSMVMTYGLIQNGKQPTPVPATVHASEGPIIPPPPVDPSVETGQGEMMVPPSDASTSVPPPPAES